MAKIKFSEVNTFVKNLFNQTSASNLENSHSGRIREWFIANMSKIGRYAHRDFERFGNLRPENILIRQGRQDGWVSLTEEVSDPNHTTYGTGVLYIHGELELPDGNPIENGSFLPIDPRGKPIGGENANGNNVSAQFDPEVTGRFIPPETHSHEVPPDADPGTSAGYKWEFTIEEPPYGGYIPYSQVLESVSGIKMNRALPNGGGGKYNDGNGYRPTAIPTATATTPSVFNDDLLYDLDNERNNYPMLIINSAAPESVDRLLAQRINGHNGMYDGKIPEMVRASEMDISMKVDTNGRKMILDHISPLTADYPVDPVPPPPQYRPSPVVPADPGSDVVPAGTVYAGALPADVMDQGPDYEERVTIPRGTIRSVKIQTTSRTTNRGEFKWIQPSGVPGGSCNAWVSTSPGGAPLNTNARVDQRTSVVKLNYNCSGEQVSTLKGTAFMNPSSTYYINIENYSTSTSDRERVFKVKTFGPGV